MSSSFLRKMKILAFSLARISQKDTLKEFEIATQNGWEFNNTQELSS